MTRNAPTPAATVRMRTVLGMASTCWARTVRSGSATVMMTPSTKAAARGTAIWRERLMYTPMPLPIGVMDRSTPRVNTPRPTIRSTAPKRNSTSVPGVRGTAVMLRSSTMAVMGRTEDRDSRIFSNSWGLIRIGGSFPAPGGALVFMSTPILQDSSPLVQCFSLFNGFFISHWKMLAIWAFI